MFTLGAFDTESTPGLTAILRSWTSLPAPAPQLVETPGVDGALYAETTFGSATWTFDLVAIASTPEQVMEIAHKVAGHLNPKRGLQPLTINGDPGWQWQASTSQPIEWERGFWQAGLECQLRAEVTLLAPDPYAYAAPDETWARTTPGGLSVTRNRGNADSHPTVEIAAVLTAGQNVTATINGTQVKVNGPLASGQVLRLDYNTLDFGVWEGTQKVASAVNRMSTFDRPTLPAGTAASTSIATTGTLQQFRVTANSRRI